LETEGSKSPQKKKDHWWKTKNKKKPSSEGGELKEVIKMGAFAHRKRGDREIPSQTKAKGTAFHEPRKRETLQPG